jgi:hypothetical protein
VKRRETVILIGVILAAGTAAFSVGRTAALRRSANVAGPQDQWLRDASPDAVQTEHHFEEQTRQRLEEVRAKQDVLASMLPDDRFTGLQILGQVDDIARSYATLARSVGGHMVYLRSVLPEIQGQQVMQSCANSLRGSLQRRYRWRGGAQDQGEGSPPGGRRGGWGRGAGGQGSGYGRQYRGGRGGDTPGLARRLQLTQEQDTWIQQQDPNFAEQSAALRERLYEVHADLVASLERTEMTGQELAAKIEAVIEAHETLEKRVAQHIVLLRPQLSPEQRDRLCDECRGGAGSADPSASTGPYPLGSAIAGFLSGPVLADL